LATQLHTLSVLADSTEVDRVADLATRLRDRRLRILVVGEAKRGKSSLINALISQPLLPVGATPLTALPITVRHGDHEHVTVTFADRHTETRPAADLAVLGTEGGNPGNRLGVVDLVVDTPAAMLTGGAELVDTPGVGSVHDRSAAAAVDALDTMDAAVIVLTADPPISASERDFLHRVRGSSVALFCVLNKTDRLDPTELDEVAAFTTAVVGAATGRATRLYLCSARTSLIRPAGIDDPGVAALRQDLTRYLTDRADSDLARSVAGHAARITARLADQARLTHRAITLRAQDAQTQLDAFADQLTAVQARHRDALDLADRAVSRALADLNAAAGRDAPLLAAEIRAAVVADIDQTPAASTETLEDQARQRAVRTITATANTWLHEQQQQLSDTLSTLDRRLVADLEDQLRDVRDAAERLLDLRLEVPAAGQPLFASVPVSYAFGEDIGVTVAWQAAVRRHLPRRFGRRAVRAHLCAEAGMLTERQIGRIRAALQQALRSAAALLNQTVTARYDIAIGGLRRALAQAADISHTAGQETALAALESRIAELDRLAAGWPTGPDAAATDLLAQPAAGTDR
jgi:GTP-binding protein EngB required for normal cell division